MQKVLLFGATGMAGHIVYHYLSTLQKYEIIDLVYRVPLTNNSILVDVTNCEQVADVIQRTRPDIIINCVGVLIKGSREHPDNAIWINAYFPHFLKKVADQVGAKVIHISTDCVFSGKKGNYSETDFRDADDIYGRSKALGELVNEKDLTIRTSIIGPELKSNGEGLFHWFMNQEGVVQGYTTAIWGGVTTLELAKALHRAIEAGLTGLVQLSNGASISKYELLRLIQQIWKKHDVEILPVDKGTVDKSIAKSMRFDYCVPSYEQMLVELYDWMWNHKDIYKTVYPCVYC